MFQDSYQWWDLVNTVMNLRGSVVCREFLKWLSNCWLSRRIQLHDVDIFTVIHGDLEENRCRSLHFALTSSYML
jgi:hypothetical protein